MSDQVDSGQESQEADDLASQEPSQTSDDSKLDSLAGAELAQATRDDPVAMEALRREFQSDKDRGVASAEKTAREALSMVEQLAGYLDMKPDQIKQAQRNMVLDGLIASQTDSKPAVSEQQAAEIPAIASSINYNKAYKNVGVEPPDTLEDIEWALRFQSQDDLENELSKRKAAKPTKPASPGTVISPGGGKATALVEVDDLVNELAKLHEGDTNLPRQAEIEKLLRDAGEFA